VRLCAGFETARQLIACYILRLVQKISKALHHERTTIGGTPAYRNAVFATFPDITHCPLQHLGAGWGALADIFIDREQSQLLRDRTTLAQALIVSLDNFVERTASNATSRGSLAFARTNRLGRVAHSASDEPLFRFVERDRGPLRLVLCARAMETMHPRDVPSARAQGSGHRRYAAATAVHAIHF
jgi:hypothetical protein